MASQAIDALAAEIGEKVYIDVAKWHLYLSNANLHTVLAEQFYPLLANDELSEEKVLSYCKRFQSSSAAASEKFL